MTFFVGLDWATTTHAVCVIDDTGGVRWRGTVPHTAAGLTELVERLTRFGSPASLAVALERPSGLVVDTLLDAGFRVVPIHPNVVKATRPRYSATAANTDPAHPYLRAPPPHGCPPLPPAPAAGRRDARPARPRPGPR